ncbi:MAG: hypothetical protein KVP17_004319 [Porospora cf. gigantea B]|uniref:uncharacterized protein n=1 Tax=Porospora cf. gigantea B TaxID=2853592 RepID=UPI003571A922|nr:MAG: hypothetical protein KVP17_004319 [Porospora cf. gigantea B]
MTSHPLEESDVSDLEDALDLSDEVDEEDFIIFTAEDVKALASLPRERLPRWTAFHSQYLWRIHGILWFMMGVFFILPVYITVEPPRFPVCETSSCDPSTPLKLDDCSQNYSYVFKHLSVVTEFNIPHSACAPNPLHNVNWTVSALYLGGIIGAACTGTLNSMVMAIGSIIMGIAPNVTVYGVGCGLAGSGVTGAALTSMILYAETTDRLHRQFIIGAQSAFFAFGVIVTSVLTSLLPSWRIQTLLLSLPALFLPFVLPCSACFVESPRWLVATGRQTRALKVVRHIVACDEAVLDPCVTDDNVDLFLALLDQDPADLSTPTREAQLAALSSRDKRRATDRVYMACCVWPLHLWMTTLVSLWFVASYGYVGLALESRYLTEAVILKRDLHLSLPAFPRVLIGSPGFMPPQGLPSSSLNFDTAYEPHTAMSFMKPPGVLETRDPPSDVEAAMNPVAQDENQLVAGVPPSDIEAVVNPVVQNELVAGVPPSDVEAAVAPEMPEENPPVAPQEIKSGDETPPEPPKEATPTISGGIGVGVVDRLRNIHLDTDSLTRHWKNIMQNLSKTDRVALMMDYAKDFTPGEAIKAQFSPTHPLYTYFLSMRRTAVSEAVSSLVEMLLVFMLVWLAGFSCVGRVRLVYGTLLISGCCSLMAFLIRLPTAPVPQTWSLLLLEVVCQVGKISVGGCVALLYLYCLELFPTTIKHGLVSLLFVTAKFAAFITPLVTYSLEIVHHSTPLLVVGGTMLAVMVMPGQGVPETLGRPMFDNIMQMQDAAKLNPTVAYGTPCCHAVCFKVFVEGCCCCRYGEGYASGRAPLTYGMYAAKRKLKAGVKAFQKMTKPKKDDEPRV